MKPRKTRIGRVVAIAAVAAWPVYGAGPTAPPADFFPIGVAGQQAEAFGTWKARGINTVVGNLTQGAWQDFWNDTAVANGLWQIRNPRLNLVADIHQPYLLAWAYLDLPEVNKVPASTLAATYTKWKMADPNRRVLINLSAAGAISQTDSVSDAGYTAYTHAADWVSSEVFPVSALNTPTWIDKTQSSAATAQNPGAGVAKLRTLSGGEKQLAYIETSDRDGAGGNRAPTAAEVRGETWDAIVHGAKGIIYSPAGKGTDDATAADVAAGITTTDALITKYAGPLVSLADDSANTVDLGGGLEGTYRVYQGKRYYFVLNDSHSTISNARFALTGMSGSSVMDVPDEGRTVMQSAGITADSFSPYQVHIYETQTGVGSGVPEPTSLSAGLLAMAALIGRRRPRGE